MPASDPEQRLAGRAPVGPSLLEHLDLDRELGLEPFAQPLGDVGHPVVRGGSMPELTMDLLGSERWFAPGSEALRELVEGEVVDGGHDDEPRGAGPGQGATRTGYQ